MDPIEGGDPRLFFREDPRLFFLSVLSVQFVLFAVCLVFFVLSAVSLMSCLVWWLFPLT